MKNTTLASSIPARKGSSERMFNANGEVNANNKKDLLGAISHLMEVAGVSQVVSEETAAANEEQAAIHREMVRAAFDSKEELAALGDTLAQKIKITSDRQGFARRFLQFQDLVDGGRPEFQVDTQLVTASIATGPVRTKPQIVRDNVLYPNEFYITARPYIEQRHLATTSGDQLGAKYNQALQATMVQEDLTWKAMADDLEGTDNPFVNILGSFTPQHFSYMTNRINSWGIAPRFALLAADLWGDITSDASWQGVIDPVSQQELLLTGRLGTIYGTNILTEQFRHPQHKILDAGDVYIVGDPSMHGGYTDRGGVQADPIDHTTENIPGRGWAMYEMFSACIANSRSVMHGRRRGK